MFLAIPMSEKLNIFSFNTRGLGNKKKRNSIFAWLKDKSHGFFLLQETHSISKGENEWSDEWGSNIVFSHGESNARGVAILIPNNLDIKINQVKKDNDGRLIVLDCTISDDRYIIVNIYAPTIDKKQEQVNFINSVLDMLQSYLGENIIIGGDFNLDLDKSQKEIHSNNPGYIRQLSLMIQTFDLVDIWRLKHPHTTRYTRREKTRYGLKQSRLDYIFITCNLEFTTTHCDIRPSIKSDHSLLILSLSLENEPKKGRGLWKLNVKLLTDSSYVKFIKNVIKDSIEDSSNLVDVGLKWDYIKCRIRTESITFSIKKRKISKTAFDNLSKRLSELEAEVSSTPTPDSVEEYYLVKNQLDNLYDDL